MWAYFAPRAGWLKINVGTNLRPQIYMYLSALDLLCSFALLQNYGLHTTLQSCSVNLCSRCRYRNKRNKTKYSADENVDVGINLDVDVEVRGKVDVDVDVDVDFDVDLKVDVEVEVGLAVYVDVERVDK